MIRRALACLCCIAAAPAVGEVALVPQPASLVREAGELRASSIGSASNDAGAARAAARLRQLLSQTHGVKTAVAAKGAAVSIRFERVTDAALGDEGYRLTVRPAGAIAQAASDAGLSHAATTLWQLAEKRGDDIVLPAVRIEDRPRFAWRGILLDSARHYQSPEFIRGFIDAMAAHKLNVLHWHLTDDQAWRLEIRKYPRLTQVGAWRVPAGAARRDIDPATGKPRLYGGSYSQRTVRELVRYAAERGITIIPEIEMPGHASAALVAYPRLGAAHAPTEVPSDWGVYPNVYSLEESTFAFLQDVLREVMALFPGRYIHVGGDEVERAQWIEGAAAKARLQALGIDDPARVQPYFTQRIARFLEANGRRLVGWDEILEPGLAPGAVVMSWRGTEGAIKAARRGHDTVLAAHPTLYFDNRQADTALEPPGRVRVVSLRDVYAFEPLPPELSADEARHVLGLQGNVWTEHIRTGERVLAMTFPRAAAIAELGWSARRSPFEDFQARLDAVMTRYAAIGLGDAARLEAARRAPQAAGDPLRKTSRELRLCGDSIALGLEDDAPLAGPRAIFSVDIQNPCWIFPAVPLDRPLKLRAAVGQVPFNFQIGEAVKQIRFATPATAEGELEVRLGCEGEVLARAPLAPALRSDAVTTLPAVALPVREGRHDLCLRFAQPRLDPMWMIDSVELAR